MLLRLNLFLRPRKVQSTNCHSIVDLPLDCVTCQIHAAGEAAVAVEFDGEKTASHLFESRWGDTWRYGDWGCRLSRRSQSEATGTTKHRNFCKQPANLNSKGFTHTGPPPLTKSGFGSAQQDSWKNRLATIDSISPFVEITSAKQAVEGEKSYTYFLSND